MTDTIVLGLDGANWNLLEPWLEAGDLPNIEALRDDGVWTDMESVLPPVTCPNWRCYSTGKNPGNLGVFWWEKIDTEGRKLSTPDARSFRSANYWDYCNDEDLSVGVMNLPMTYPPFEIDDFMIAGGPDSEQDAYAHPAVLGDELDADGYQLHPETPVTSKADRVAADGVVDLIDDRMRTFRTLITERNLDVVHLTVFYVNVLQHFFWRGEPTRRAWEVIDEHIGEIRTAYPDATLMLMSDHGCHDIDTVFYANSWLEEEGYLVTAGDTVSGAFDAFGINKERVGRIAHKLGINSLVTKLTPAALKAHLPDSDEGFRRQKKLDRVVWEDSRAIASGQGLIYVIDDRRGTREEILSKLEALESDITGQPVAREVLTCEAAYNGPYTDNAPDIVFDQRPGVHTSGAIGSNPVFAETGKWEAENVRTGLFLADGPDVVADELEPMSITDVAPTVLHSLGCQIPTDLDGAPAPIFADGDWSEREPLPYKSGGDVAGQDAQQRLADLGYLE